MSPTIVIYILSAAVAGLVGRDVVKWAFQKDTEVENRRRAAANLAAKLKEVGLSKTPEFLIDYSVGDYSGMFEKIHDLAKLFLSGDQHVMEEFDNVYNNVLAAHLKTEAGRALIAAKLADAVKATDPGAVSAAPQAKVSASAPAAS